MTRAELITVIKEAGLEDVYRKELSKATRIELEAIYVSLLEGADKHYSHTQIQTYMGCGLQYYFRYIRGLKIPPKGILTRNKSLHRVFAVNYNTLMGGDQLSVTDKIELFHDDFKDQVQKDAPIIEEDNPLPKLEEHGKGVIMVNHNVARNVRPVTVEEEIEFEIEGRNIVAILDLVSSEGIIDHKIKSKRMSQQEKEGDMQLPIYSIAKGIRSVGFDNYCGEKTVAYDPYRTMLSENQISVAKAKLICYVQGIESKVFLPCDSSHWRCSEKWCGYYKLCHEEVLV